MNDVRHIAQDDLALYALQALCLEESAAVREHLSGCEVCRAEMASLEGDLAMVALSVEQEALPAGARERFCATARKRGSGRCSSGWCRRREACGTNTD